jgi:hypothetical protein
MLILGDDSDAAWSIVAYRLYRRRLRRVGCELLHN